ncbi:MAG: UDP-N-acetylglucosamine acyltransferase [Proteobacteria bacterium]|nr:UDP-N-acetylglucosamine acyltransferase [Pseudomonadota bacterium]
MEMIFTLERLILWRHSDFGNHKQAIGVIHQKEALVFSEAHTHNLSQKTTNQPDLMGEIKMIKKITILIATLALLSGCASAPPLNFVPQDVLPAKNKVAAELKSVTVSVAKEEERLGETQVGFMGNQYELSFKTALKDALDEALLKSAVFNDLSDRKVSLTAKVMKFESPNGGITFETEAIVRYEVYDRRDGKLLFRRDISSTGSVPFDYAFAGFIRATEARNRTMRANVTNFISSLEELKIQP